MVVDQGLSLDLPVLYGRDEECATIEGLLDGAREGRSQSLLVRGAAGVGKSALLDHALVLARTNGMRTLRACGVESESELAFAGLHQLLRPVLGLLERIPQPQAAALRGALGLAPAAGPDRLLVAAGVLSLLAEAAEEGPLVCAVDDVKWVDQPSVAALGFAARRLEAEGVVVLLAGRDDELNGPALISPRQQTEAIGEALGVPLRFVEQTPDQARALWRQFLPEPAVDDTLAILGDPLPTELQLSPDVERVLGRPPRSFAEWAARNAAAFK